MVVEESEGAYCFENNTLPQPRTRSSEPCCWPRFGAMPDSPGKIGLLEGEGTVSGNSRRLPVEHAAVEERRTDETERRHEESTQIPERVEFQQWMQSQQEELQQGEAGSSSGHLSGGGRRSPKDTDNREGSPRDAESSSLSALSNFSTGLSVSSNLRFRNFLIISR